VFFCCFYVFRAVFIAFSLSCPLYVIAILCFCAFWTNKDRYCCFLCRLFLCCSKFVQDKFNLSITMSGYVAGAVYYVSMILSPFLGFIIVRLQLHLAVLAFVDVVHNGDAKIL